MSLGLEVLAVSPLEPLFTLGLPVKTLPVRKPIAKNAKYIMAAGCESGFFKTGGRFRETEVRLLRITWTKKAATISAKIVFRNSFIKAAGR
jgi:hypothetical protein